MSQDQSDNTAERGTPVSQPVFIKALLWSTVATVLIAVLMGTVGYFVAAKPGLTAGLIGAGAAGVFFALTLLSIVIGNRFSGSDMYVVIFFAVVVGSWLLKFIFFIVGALLLKHQTWLDPKIFFISVIIGAIVSLVIESIVIFRSRMPIVNY